MLRLFGLITVLVLSGLALQACSVKKTAEASCNFVQNSEQQRVSWGAQVPAVLFIDSSVPNEYTEDIKSAVAVWNKRVGREVLKVGGYTDDRREPGQDGKNIIYFRQTWESDRQFEQARTTVYWAGDRIYEADVRINAKDFRFSSGELTVSGQVDMESLLIHEFGHVLGLAHSNATQSVMARTLPDATERRELSKADEESIRCEY